MIEELKNKINLLQKEKIEMQKIGELPHDTIRRLKEEIELLTKYNNELIKKINE